jgi:hypothetical protein
VNGDIVGGHEMLTLAYLILGATAASAAPDKGPTLTERCEVLEATLAARGDVLFRGKLRHLEPFVDRFRLLTSRGGRTWVRLKEARGAWMFQEGETCRPGLVLAREPPSQFDPGAPEAIVQIDLLDPIRRLRKTKIRFVQRMTVFNIQKGLATAQEPMCYRGELTRGATGWTALVLEVNFKASTSCR